MLKSDLSNPVLANLTNAKNHAFDFTENITGGYAGRCYALGPEPFGSPPIPFYRLGVVVSKPIDLQSQPRSMAVEIEDILSGRVLSAKLETTGAPAQFTPKHNLG